MMANGKFCAKAVFTIFVSFGEPKIYSSKYKTASDIFLPIEVSLYPKGGTSSVIKNPSQMCIRDREYNGHVDL